MKTSELRQRARESFANHFPPTELPDDYWTIEDARAWSNFKSGDTGTKISFILRNKVADTAQRAIMENTDKASWLCGVAFGVRATVAELDSLLDVTRTKEGFSLSDEELEELMNKK